LNSLNLDTALIEGRAYYNDVSRSRGIRYSDKYPRASDSFKVSGDLAYTLESNRAKMIAKAISDRQKFEENTWGWASDTAISPKVITIIT